MELSILYIELPRLDFEYYKYGNIEESLWGSVCCRHSLILFPSGWLTLLLLFLCMGLLFIIYLGLKDMNTLWFEVVRQREQLNNNLDTKPKMDRSAEKTASIVHEIKRPLTAMSMLADLTIQDMNKPATKNRDKEVLDNLKEIVKQGQQCSRMICKMQNPSGEDHAEFRPTDVNSIIIQALSEIPYHRCKNGVTIRQDLQQNLSSIEADGKAIHQVFTNLFENAIDAMHDSNQKILTISSSNSGQGILIEVTDTGCGVNGNNDNQIFDPFYTTKGDKGMGLGLSISKSIVDAHNGSLTMKNDITQDTCFKVFLPLYQ